MILSASRRTDIPGYYSKWFMNRLKAGYALTRNPMNLSQVSRITLSPETIDCIVFWTKDPADMLDKLPQLDALGYSYYFQFTLTPYGKDIERNLRDKMDIAETFRQLSRALGKGKLLWRYDPIVLNDKCTEDYHYKNFTALCRELEGYTDICTISFVDIYHKINKSVKESILRDITEEQMHRVAAGFCEIGRSYGIELQACCERADLSVDGVKPAACIDKELITRICGHSITAAKDKSQRPGCGCIQSVDIGVYNTCKNGCIYCYANHSDESIHKNCLRHDPYSDILIGTVEKSEKIISRG